MAHKTLISGTAYEVSGGKTLVDGTTYKIKNGKTLVDGTAYDIGFIPIIKVDGGVFMELGAVAYVKANGELLGNIFGTTEKYTFPVGTIIQCTVGAPTGYTGTISINGETVVSFEGVTGIFGGYTTTYDYVVTTSATIVCREIYTGEVDGTAGQLKYGTIEITEH